MLRCSIIGTSYFDGTTMVVPRAAVKVFTEFARTWHVLDPEGMNSYLELIDYRHRVEAIYTTVRGVEPSAETWRRWRESRDQLFATHPQTPIEDAEVFDGLAYFEYDPKWRVIATLDSSSDEETTVGHSGEGATTFRRIGSLRFELDGAEHSLDAMWLDSYGGGLFVPFRDRTNGDTTYGGGRYILDTVKGADLGRDKGGLVLDFNYSYHPSCVHSPRWSCPLAPPANHLDIAIEAGERL
jgi:uncharacterized protein (DUF1684 family)